MGFIIGLIKRLLRLLIFFTIFALLIVIIPNLPPYTTFSSIKLSPTQKIEQLATNGVLNNAEKLYKGKLLGPEAFQLYNGEVYTSLSTGEIVKLSPGGHVTFVTKIGRPCVGIVQEHICGRPLGFEIDEKTNMLYVADAYHGIWKVDLKTDKKQLLVSPQVSIDGRYPKLINSIALAKNGDFYWTDSTSDFHLKDGVFSVLADPAGRLLHYNAAKNQSRVLLEDLWFANGVVLSSDHQFVLVSETSRYRVLKHYVDGPKKGATEVFVDGLPGTPDNLRTLPDGSGVLVALYTAFDEENPLLAKSMSETPLVRKFLARIQRLIEIPFEYLNTLYPHIILEEIIYNIGHFKSISALTPKMSGLVQIDWNGKIIASYYNTDGTLGHISDAIVFNGKLYTGSPHLQEFIGSVPAPPLLLNAFSKTKKVTTQEVPKVPVPQQQQKPTQKVQEKVDNKKVPEPVLVKPIVKPVETTKPSSPTPEQKKPNDKVKQQAPPAKQPTPSQPKQTEQKPTSLKEKHVKQAPPQKPEAKVTATPEVKVAPKPDMKTTPKPETKPTPKPETKPTPKPETKPTPKPETKPIPNPKPDPKINSKPATTPMPKAADPKPATEKPIIVNKVKPQEPEKKKYDAPKPPQQNMKKEEPKPVPQEIPITEEISSDTAKPNKDTLKVIKKGGPAEIPNPNLV